LTWGYRGDLAGVEILRWLTDLDPIPEGNTQSVLGVVSSLTEKNMDVSLQFTEA